MARFITKTMTVAELLDLGDKMSVRGLQSQKVRFVLLSRYERKRIDLVVVKVWQFWIELFEEERGYRLNGLNEKQLWIMKHLFQSFSRPTQQIAYRLALLSSAATKALPQ